METGTFVCSKFLQTLELYQVKMNLLNTKRISVTWRIYTTCYILILCPYLFKDKNVPEIIRKKICITKLYLNFLQTKKD